MNTIKRVLWISDYFPRPHNMTLGVWALESIYAIQRKGIEVVVLCPTPWLPPLFTFTNNLKKWRQVPSKFIIDSINIFYPKCPHYPNRFIIKYLYNHFPYFESSFLIDWIKPAIKEIMENYPFEAVHSNFIFPAGYIGYEIKKMYKIPFMVHERSINRLSNALNHKLRRKLYIEIVKEADAVIAPNRKIAGTIEKFLTNEKKVNVIRDPGSPGLLNISSLFQSIPEKYRNKKVIFSVGSLIERKGHEFLIKAIDILKEEFKNIRCIIAGNGVRKKSLQKLIDHLKLNQYIEMTGQLPHDEVLNIMSWCDIFVLPSWDEACGTVYGEAMSFGKPIVACKEEGLSEFIENGKHGLLVNKKDERSIAEAIKKLLSDEALAISMGSESKLFVEKEFNYDFIASEIIEIYNKIVNNVTREKAVEII